MHRLGEFHPQLALSQAHEGQDIGDPLYGNVGGQAEKVGCDLLRPALIHRPASSWLPVSPPHVHHMTAVWQVACAGCLTALVCVTCETSNALHTLRPCALAVMHGAYLMMLTGRGASGGLYNPGGVQWSLDLLAEACCLRPTEGQLQGDAAASHLGPQ